MDLAVDISNYTPTISVPDVHCWMANGVSRAIVQAVQGGGRYPPGRTPQQLQTCAEGGLRTDGYILPFSGDSISNLRAKHALTKGYRIGRWWGDFEEPMNLDYVRFVLTEMDTWAADEGPVGFYTGWWWYRQYLPNVTEFANRPLWIMDNQHAAGSPALFGGWSDWAMHQYWLDASLCGISGIDVSAINPSFVTQPSGGNSLIRVGEGMNARMKQNNDHPLFGHKFWTETDDDGKSYQVEECYGMAGRYVSSNSSGQWENAGPF
jgi:hypothetical protein